MNINNIKKYCNNFLKSVVIQNNTLLNQLTKIERIVFVGSSGTGKSTLIDSLRNIKEINIPKRFTTRPLRKNDNLIENSHLSLNDFNDKCGKSIGIHWERKMENNRVEKYGFDINCLKTHSIQILSGNNAMFNNKFSLQPKDILNLNTLWIGVYAPLDTLKNRLLNRSPDLAKNKPEEFKHRLKDLPENIFNHVHLTVNNFGALQNNSKVEIQNLIKKILSL